MLYLFVQTFLSQAMVLRNHGIVVCGETIEEAFSMAQNAVKACSFQVITFTVYVSVFTLYSL